MPGPYPLKTLSVTIDAYGIRGPTFEDIVASLEASYRQIYGADVNLAPDSQDGQWLAIQAQAMYDNNQSLIAGYLAYSPATAQGIGLSSVVKINGLQRLPTTRSTAELRIVGITGTTIDNGIASDVYSVQWVLPTHVVIPIEGEITVTAQTEMFGEITAAPDTITTIVTRTPGWQTVTNPLPAFPGLPIETDAILRKRQTFSTSLPAITPRESIAAAIANVPNVGRTYVHDNDTHHYDSELVPPHTIACIVEGGNANDIAKAIFIKKNVGCGTYGNVQITLLDSHGVPQPINFFYLREVPIYVNIRIEPKTGYLETIGLLAADTVIMSINKYLIGENVFASRLVAPANLSGDEALEISGRNQIQLDLYSKTYVVRDIFIGTEMNPDKSYDIDIPYNAAAHASRDTVKIVIAQ
jgi:uncharacterized phage protein gp47/JayE